MVSSLSSFSLSRQTGGQVVSTFSGASNFNVGNIGKINGTASFTLSETSDGYQASVFDVMHMGQNDALYIDMAGNNNNTRFSGYNINASFNSENSLGYNVELNTINSMFDFSGTNSGAQISSTANSAYNMVQLGGGKNIVHQETIAAGLTQSGLSDETRAFNNLVTDSGYSNVFLSSNDSVTKFETTTTSAGAFFQGGQVGDVVNIGGRYGVFQGGNGNNIFTTSEWQAVGVGSIYNVVFGGLGTNAYNDYGDCNMYQGAYALYGDGYNGYDTIRFNGNYGIARVDASGMDEGYDPTFEYRSGQFNAGFTGESATLDGMTYDYDNILHGRVGKYANATPWNLQNFYSSNYSPTGYAALYGSQLLGLVMDE